VRRVALICALGAVGAACAAATSGAAPVGPAAVPATTTTTTSSPAATAQQAISILNAQRTTNDLPAGIVENPTWSNDCLMHDEYMSMNGDVLTHTEVSTDPGYSAGGAFAGANSVLAEGTGWADGNPYEHAPIHLDQLLAPRLDVVGSADADGFSCTTTYPGWTRSAPTALTVYTYPGPGAAIYSSEVAREQPFTPAGLVGLSRADTGPYLLVFVDAPGQAATDNPATLSGAVLTGPSGTVPVVTADGDTAIPRSDQAGCTSGTLACFIAPGGFIIPARPLQPGATYHVHVDVTFAGVTTPHGWAFSTTGLPPESSLTLVGHRLRFRSSSSAPVLVRFTRASGAHAPSRTIAPGHGYLLTLAPGSWQACGTQAPAGHYAGYQQCLTILVTGQPKLAFGSPRVRRAYVRFPVVFSPVLRGRTATLTVTPLTAHCHAKRCTTTAGAPTTKTITLHSPAINLPLPAEPEQGYRLELQTTAFELRDAPWLAAQATSKPFIRR
jgi:hypothetical protein